MYHGLGVVLGHTQVTLVARNLFGREQWFPTLAAVALHCHLAKGVFVRVLTELQFQPSEGSVDEVAHVVGGVLGT